MSYISRKGQQTVSSDVLVMLLSHCPGQLGAVGGEFLCAFWVEHLPVPTIRVTVAAVLPSTVSQTACSMVL